MILIDEVTKAMLMNIIAKSESDDGDGEIADDYQRVNSLGYAGRYQFGVMALIDAGLMKPGSHKGRSVKTAMNDPAAWIAPWSLKKFLASPARQDAAMSYLLAQNERALIRLKVIDGKTPKADVCGYLMTAHLLGCGGARDLKNGIDAKDAYGTKASDYFKRGVAAAPR